MLKQLRNVYINALLLHYSYINDDYTWYSICSAWFLDIRISNLFLSQFYFYMNFFLFSASNDFDINETTRSCVATAVYPLAN